MMFLHLITVLILLLSAVTASVGSYSKDPNITLILLSDSTILGLDDVLEFNCVINSTSSNVDLHQIFLLIDNSGNSTKMDRVTVTKAPSSKIYQFNVTEPSDNGTEFTCVLAYTPFSDPIASTETIVLEVEYAPIFDMGNNLTLYHYIKPGMNSSMSCAINASNPTLDSFTVTNNSHSVANVHVNYSTMVISITNAITDNSGTYTCTATNDEGTSYLSYTTFIGGAPDSVNILVNTVYSTDTLTISVGVIDDSQSPANALTVGISDVLEHDIDLVAQGYTLPVRNEEMIALTIPLDTLYTSNYNLYVTAKNPLGSTNVYNKQLYIEGTRPLKVDLIPYADEVNEGQDYMFNCSIPEDYDNVTGINITFAVLIDNSTNGDKLTRGVAQPDSQEFIIQNVSYVDNGLTLTCVVNDVYHSSDVPINVYFVPKILSRVDIPIKRLSDPSFTINIEYIANPSLHFVDWKRNGVIIHTGKNFQINYNNLTFVNVLPTDNGTYSVNLTNEVGSSTVDFDMIVYYAPILSFPKRYGGFYDQSLTVSVSVLANPLPSKDNFTWYHNGSPLKPSANLSVEGSVLDFTHFMSSDVAIYTLIVTNCIGTRNTSIELIGYNGPYFWQGDSNSSYPLLHESRSGADFNLTCTVKYSFPPVEELIISPSTGPNWHMIHENDTSATLVFKKGNAQDNTRMFNCTAKTKNTTAVLVYDSYIGGVPDKTSVSVNYTSNKDRVVISVKVTDDSSVPATHILYHLQGKDNVSLVIQHPPLKGSSVSFDLINMTYGSLGGPGTSHVMKIYIANNIGAVLGTTVDIDVPAVKSKKSRAGAIAAGIIVPVAVLALIIVGVVTYFYYKRKKTRGGFTLLADENDSNINSSGYRTDKVIT